MSATMAIECRSFPCWKQDSVSSMPAKSPQLVPLTASFQRSHLGHRLHDLSTKRPMRPRSIRLPKATPPTPLNPVDPTAATGATNRKPPPMARGRYNDDSCSYERRVDFIAFRPLLHRIWDLVGGQRHLLTWRPVLACFLLAWSPTSPALRSSNSSTAMPMPCWRGTPNRIAIARGMPRLSKPPVSTVRAGHWQS